MMRVLSIASVASVAVLLLTGSAIGGGGRTIATAPTMPVGQQQLNTLDGIDFWRIPLKNGDRLMLDFGPQQRFAWMQICLFKPDVTDATIGNQPCYASQNALQQTRLTLDARPGGLWTLAVVPYPGCESGGILKLQCPRGVSYQVTAYVKHRTNLTLRGPTIARHGSPVTAAGVLTGSHGSVLLERSWSGGRWRTIGIAHPAANGSFRVRVTPKRTGSLRVRATYPEAPSYIGSRASLSIRVV
jgi:hypothetical protein